MKQRTVVAILLGTLLCAATSTRAKATDGVTATLTLPQSRYLSTQQVEGTLTIDNLTDAVAYWNPTSVSFAIRKQDGSIESRRLITTITRSIANIAVAAHSAKDFPITMPTCMVVADPCEQHVAIKLSVYFVSGQQIDLETQERSYVFDPDPTATYQIDGVSGNRPAIVVTGSSAGTIIQRTLKIVFAFAPGTASDAERAESTAIDAAFDSRAIRRSSNFPVGDPDGTKVVEIVQGSQSSIDAAISDVRAKFPDIVAINRTYSVENSDVFDFIRSNADDARTRAQPLIGLLGLDSVDRETTLGTPDVVEIRPTADSNSAYVRLLDFPFDRSDATASDSERPVDIRSSNVFEFTGDAPANLTAAPSKATVAKSYLDSSSEAAPLPLRLTIAADRPEVLAFGAIRESDADRFGLQAASAAAEIALERARDFVHELEGGSSNTPSISLVARLPERALKDDSVETSAAALGTDASLDGRWLALDGAPASIEHEIATRDRARDWLPIVLPNEDKQIVASANSILRFRVERNSVRIDCEREIAIARARSTDAALHDAVLQSHRAGRRLRHLVVAAALLPFVHPSDSCAPGLRTHAREDIRIEAPVELRFRTF